MFDRVFMRVNTFEDFRTELVEGKEKRAGTELAQEITKKQKVEDDKETAEIKKLMEFIPDEEEVAIDAIPLAVKSSSIVDWKIRKEGRKSYYQIIRADVKSQMYTFFSQMLKSFDMGDLEDLYKLGRIVEIKSLLVAVRITAAQVYVNTALMKLVLLMDFEENMLRIDNDIYSTVDACPNACKMWKAIERLKQEWQRFVTLVKQSQELKTVSYHKLYDILKQHQTEVNEIRAKRLAPATRNRGKEIVNSSTPTYDQEPTMVAEDDKILKDKEIDKLMALISLSFKKIYKPTNNNLRTLSNTSRAYEDNTSRINRGTRYDNQRVVNVAGARENVGTPVVQQSGIQCYSCKEYGHVARECQNMQRMQDDTDDEPEDQELEAHYMYMTQIQEVTPDAADNSRPIFNAEPLQKIQINDDNYNVFAIENKQPEQPESVNDTYLEEQGDTNITIDSLDMCNNIETVDHDDDDLTKERDLLASLIEELKCEIDNRKTRNKFLETSNKALVDKMNGEIKDFKTKNKSLESLNNHFKEANNQLSKTNQLMFKDLKKFQAELDRYHDVNYASKVEIDCAKAKGDLMSYKMESEKSSNAYT
ncbi:uncharacterized mitochondrial protein-like protein [Tanacetum coccineum]|uniref:Uncharacterized mitochondrial protein-like protein n=1 Tax=Tanacetum coccineum TaxID=301880 RepID=A0ABQ5AAH8_9ASTR